MRTTTFSSQNPQRWHLHLENAILDGQERDVKSTATHVLCPRLIDCRCPNLANGFDAASTNTVSGFLTVLSSGDDTSHLHVKETQRKGLNRKTNGRGDEKKSQSQSYDSRAACVKPFVSSDGKTNREEGQQEDPKTSKTIEIGMDEKKKVNERKSQNLCLGHKPCKSQC